jgi:hypothetical protein
VRRRLEPLGIHRPAARRSAAGLTFNGMPVVVKKNGLLPGFSGEIVVAPSRQLAVVVLINSDTTGPADTLALDVAHNLIDSLP